jgi:hypothetical protein
MEQAAENIRVHIVSLTFPRFSLTRRHLAPPSNLRQTSVCGQFLGSRDRARYPARNPDPSRGLCPRTEMPQPAIPQNCALSRRQIFGDRKFCVTREWVVLPVRIELTTSALPRMRSTTELRQHDHFLPAHMAETTSLAGMRPMAMKQDHCQGALARLPSFSLWPRHAG